MGGCGNKVLSPVHLIHSSSLNQTCNDETGSIWTFLNRMILSSETCALQQYCNQHPCYHCSMLSKAQRRVQVLFVEAQLDACEKRLCANIQIWIWTGASARHRSRRSDPPGGKPTPREKGGKPVTGVYLKTWCGGSHLPVPASRHTVMQSMSATLVT